MSTITKFNISRENFPEYFYSTEEGISQAAHQFTHTLEITDTVLQYKLSRKKMGEETSDVTLYNIKLNINLIRNHTRLTDQSYFTIKNNTETDDLYIEETKYLFKPTGDFQSELVTEMSLLSLFDKTWQVKPSPMIIPYLASDKQYMFPLRIFVPHSAASFDQCTFHVLTTDATIKTINTEDNIVPVQNSDIWNIVADTTHTVVNSVTSYKDILASITSSTTATSPSAGTTIPVSVTCSNTSISKLYLEPIVGLLDRTEVTLTNGVGSFNILTDTLSSGNTVKIKIGYKRYSNVNTFTKTLA